MELIKRVFTKEDSVFAGFTNRHGGVSQAPFNSLNLGLHVGDNEESVIKNRKILLSELEVVKLTWMEQTHSDNIKVVNKIGEVKNTDSLITNKPKLALIVMVADCIPILFYDPVEKVIAVAHAGREGGFKNIAGKVILKMQEEFACVSKNILVSLGPSIQKTCYELEDKIIGIFKEKWGSQYIVNQKYLDLQGLNKDQLLKAGVYNKNINISNICTHCNSDYFSYRRNNKTGRFVGIIVLR